MTTILRSFWFSLLLAAPPAVAQVLDVSVPPTQVADGESNGLAIVVGVDTYKDPGLDRLSYAVKDAEAVAGYLRKQGWIVSLMRSSDADAALRPDDVETVLREVRFLASRTKRKDRLLFYFSGHGFQAGTENYVCLSGTKKEDPKTALSQTEILAAFGAGASVKKAVILDACREAPGGRNLMKGFTRKELAEARGIWHLYSAAPGYKSYEPAPGTRLDGEELANGFFTHYLLKGLAGAAESNGDGFVTLVELAMYVEEAMGLASAARTIRQQVPYLLWDGQVSGDFLLGVTRGVKDEKVSPAADVTSTARTVLNCTAYDLVLRLMRDGSYEWVDLAYPEQSKPVPSGGFVLAEPRHVGADDVDPGQLMAALERSSVDGIEFDDEGLALECLKAASESFVIRHVGVKDDYQGDPRRSRMLLQELTRFRFLESLALNLTPTLDDADWARLASLRGLRHLRIGYGPNLSGECFPVFADAWDLRSLIVLLGLHHDFDEEKVFRAIGRWRNLEWLCLSASFEGHHFHELAGLKKLRRLSLQGCRSVLPSALEKVEAVESLEVLCLQSTPAGSGGLAFLEGLRRLRVLDLSSCENVTDESLATLPALSDLTHLNLYATKVEGRGIRHLSRLKRLQCLEIGGDRVSLELLREVSRLEGLRCLKVLSVERIDPEALLELRACPNLEVLDVDLRQLELLEHGDDSRWHLNARGLRLQKELGVDIQGQSDFDLQCRCLLRYSNSGVATLGF